MEERIRQLEERISKLERPTRLTDEWRKLLIAEGFLKYDKKLIFNYISGGVNYIRLFIKVVDDIYVLDGIKSDYFKEITIGANNKILLKNHGLTAGDIPVFYSTGTLPTGIVQYNIYYVVNPTTNDFQISSTPGGTPETITAGSGIGVHYIFA